MKESGIKSCRCLPLGSTIYYRTEQTQTHDPGLVGLDLPNKATAPAVRIIIATTTSIHILILILIITIIIGSS
jgi:hypothetical protein